MLEETMTYQLDETIEERLLVEYECDDERIEVALTAAFRRADIDIMERESLQNVVDVDALHALLDADSHVQTTLVLYDHPVVVSAEAVCIYDAAVASDLT